MKKILLAAAAAVTVFGLPVVASAQGKAVYALVPKNMNNPFFDQARDGCKKAEKESGGKIECMYIGPGEHGGGDEQVQVVQDLITKKVNGIAVSPSNAPAMAKALERAKTAGIPVTTWDSDLLEKDKGLRADLRRHQELRHRRESRQDRDEAQAQGRNDLHPVGRCCCGEPQRAHARYPRHDRRQEVEGAAGRSLDQPEWLDRSGRLSAVYQRRFPALR